MLGWPDSYHARNIASSYGENVEFLTGDEKDSVGTNRNRILGSAAVQNSFDGAILYFTNNGIRYEKSNLPLADELRHAFSNLDAVGMIGGLVLNSDRKQMDHNYGPNICGPLKVAKGYFTASLLEATKAFSASHPGVAKNLRKNFAGLLKDWPIPDVNIEQHTKPTGWIYEGSLAVSLDKFTEAGMFPDTDVHGTQVLSHELSLRGLRCIFSPNILSAIKNEDVLPGISPASPRGILTALKIATRYSLPSNRQVTM